MEHKFAHETETRTDETKKEERTHLRTMISDGVAGCGFKMSETLEAKHLI